MMQVRRVFQSVLMFLLLAAGLPAQAPKTLLHQEAPAFVRTDLAGRKVDLQRYRGKVVLLNFWATWCASCQVELPRFAQWQKKYKAEGLQVIAVSMDDSAAPVRRAVRRIGPGFPVLMGDAELGQKYGGVLGLPVTFLVGRNGRIAAEFKGEANLDSMERVVKVLLERGL